MAGLDSAEFEVVLYCELPGIYDDFTSFGYDIRATYTYRWVGTFSDASNLGCAYTLDGVCEGEDCDQLTGYVEDFATPCGVEATIEASAA